MSKIIVKNGIIYDPMNNVDGEMKDILIQDGTIVEKFSNQEDVKEIDAKNKIVVPAAIDIHTHISSQQVNWARLLGTKNSIFRETWKGLTLDFIAKRYLSNGYTFVLEANVFPSLASQATFNLTMLPVLDSAYLLNLSNFWPMELEFQKGMVDQASTYLSDILDKTKAFGIKIYNPFEREEWNLKKLRDDLERKGRLYNFTPLDVYENMTRYVENLKLPHSIHAHIEAYETEQAKKNLSLVLNRIKELNLEHPDKSEQKRRSQVFHVAHASSYNMDGDNSELIKFYNENTEFDLDIGFTGFDPINPIISSDRRLINTLSGQDNPFKLIRSAIELEGDTFSSFRIFDKQNKDHCTIWANGVDLALKIKNKWQVQFSVNFPNYSSISKVPQISSWLLSNKAREDFMQEFNSDFLKDNAISSNNDSLSFYDYIIITRASPAKSLGIGDIKGNLGSGADGDLNIINLNLKKVNIQNNYQTVIDAFSNINYVIKSGKIIKKDQNLDLSTNGKIFWTEGIPKKERDTFVLNKKKEFYEKYYSTFYKSTKINLKEDILRKIK